MLTSSFQCMNEYFLTDEVTINYIKQYLLLIAYRVHDETFIVLDELFL